MSREIYGGIVPEFRDTISSQITSPKFELNVPIHNWQVEAMKTSLRTFTITEWPVSVISCEPPLCLSPVAQMISKLVSVRACSMTSASSETKKMSVVP